MKKQLSAEERETYLNIKKKLPVKNKGTQTDPCEDMQLIFVTDPNMFDHDSDEDYVPPSKKRKKPVDNYSNEEYDYYKKLNKATKTNIDKSESDISQYIKNNTLNKPLRFKILQSNMDMKLKAMALKECEQLQIMDPSTTEYSHKQAWIENICRLPVGKYKSFDVSDSVSQLLDKVKANLDKEVYGLKEVKDHIVRLIAKKISNPNSKGLVIGLSGEKGIGKTSLATTICSSLGLPFGFVSLSGLSDVTVLTGHQQTWSNSRWGKIADILMNADVSNPVLFFDELDKIGDTKHGEEVANALIHITDHSQNHAFQDKHFADVDLDLSQCLMIFSFNDPHLVNPILLDRMTVLSLNGYSLKDKVNIAKNYMLPKIYKEFAMPNLQFTDSILECIVNLSGDEGGVRNLKRSLEEIVSNINLCKILEKDIIEGVKYQDGMVVTEKIVNCFIKRKSENISLPMMYI